MNIPQAAEAAEAAPNLIDKPAESRSQGNTYSRYDSKAERKVRAKYVVPNSPNLEKTRKGLTYLIGSIYQYCPFYA